MATSNSLDLIAELLNDHRNLEKYYSNYKLATSIEEGHRWFNQFVWEISRHAVSEELVVYPLMEGLGEHGQKLSEESREGHRRLKTMLEDLRHEKDESKFEAKFDAAFQELQDHLKIEEGEDLPYIKQNVSQEDLQNLGKTFALGKKIAPTRPHPEVPDKPLALEIALGLLIAPIDKFRDVFTSFPERA